MESVKRISLMIGEQQHKELLERGVNLSGLVRDLIDDYLSEHTVVLSVNDETKSVYDQIVSNTGAKDDDIEPYFLEALKALLKERILVMQKLQRKLENNGGEQ